MRFNKEKKNAIVFYILEKIDEGVPLVRKHVAESLEIDLSTVHRYLNSLLEQGIIEKVEHGKYRLVTHTWNYRLSRSAGDLNSDMLAYSECLLPHISTLPKNVLDIWAYVFSEMINNIMDHSEAEHALITIEQDFLKTTVLLTDDGIGIFKKIQAHFGFPSIDDSIIELFKGKLTTDSVNHSGEGIFFSSRLMDRFFVISSGKVFTCNRFDDKRILDLAEENLAGTCVFMSLSNISTKKAMAVFNDYADVDGGFTRTIIPLHNIFDSPPVSRSQAKRLSNRLDSFNEVVLDFSDLSWMGQGFAHQLFVVFQNEHPDIRLIPINMEDSVKRMYDHTVIHTINHND